MNAFQMAKQEGFDLFASLAPTFKQNLLKDKERTFDVCIVHDE